MAYLHPAGSSCSQHETEAVSSLATLERVSAASSRVAASVGAGSCTTSLSSTQSCLAIQHPMSQAMTRDYYKLDFMDPSVDTSPIAPALAEFFDDALSSSVSSLNFRAIIDGLGDVLFQFPFRQVPLCLACPGTLSQSSGCGQGCTAGCHGWQHACLVSSGYQDCRAPSSCLLRLKEQGTHLMFSLAVG